MNAFLYRLAPLAVAVLLGACGPASEPPHKITTGEALDMISVEQLRQHVTVLADDSLHGRLPGEPGYDDGARYVSEQLAAMGVEPGGIDGWYQKVELRKYKLDTESAELTLHRNGEDIPLAYRDDFSLSADAVRLSATVRGEVVYAGFGVHAPEHGYSDYEGVDVRGKIIALFSGAPESIEPEARAHFSSARTKAEEAVKRGAVGVIILRSRKAEERRPWAEAKARFGSRPSMTWLSHDGRTARYYPELRGTAWLSIDASEEVFAAAPLSFTEAQESALAGEPRSLPLGLEVSMSGRHEHSSTASPNVIGVVRGTDPALAKEYVVYTAHLDHVGERGDEGDEDRIHNGMYDNAMGVALMLETARAIAAAPPKRSVLFIAVTAEESGLLGSDYFVNYPTVPIDSIVANINLDMPLFLYPLADLVAFGSEHSSLRAVVEAAAVDEGFVLSPDPVPEENLFVRSDQYSFVRLSVPAIYLVSGFNSTDDEIDGEALYKDHLENHYHEASDDITRPVHWESALRFARAHTRMGQAIGNSEPRPTWNEGAFFGRAAGRR